MKTVLFNGKIYVEKEKFVEAVLIEDRKIKAIGTNDEILATSDIDEKIDCQGKTVIPGLNDSHMHMFSLGETMYQAKISGITGKNVNASEIQERAKARKKEMDNLKNITYNKYWGK